MSKRSKKNSRAVISLVGLIFAVVAGCAAYLLYVPFFEKETELYFSDRETPQSFNQILGEHSSALHSRFYSIVNNVLGDDVIRSGHYRFTDESLVKVYCRLSSGRQDPIAFSFNNVRTLDQFAAKVDNALMIDSAQFMEKVNDSLFLRQWGYTHQTLPSLFIPNKYELYWNISLDDFFQRMKVEHDRFWNKERLELLRKSQLSEVEVSILASIVEEESNDAEDRRIIAGLYLNRIKQGMPMQACPTVRFAHNDFTITRVYNHHTLIESPYNTYSNKGLPPGPIRIPSIKAIDAVLRYVPNDYLYMCAKEDFSGKHRFSASYSEHLHNARLYQQAFDRRFKK